MSAMVLIATGLGFLSVCLVLVTCENSLKGGKQNYISITDTHKSETAKDFIVGEDSTNSTDFPESTTVDDNLTSEMKEVLLALRLTGLEVTQNSSQVSVSARMKMSDMMFNPVMMVPQLIMWGFAPIILANLKMFVMQALMINKMALSSAIFMTLRNIVFGPRPGPVVKYANYGYNHGDNNFHHYHRRS